MHKKKKATIEAKDFTSGSILKSLIHFAIPLVGALALQGTYGAVDLIIAGHFGNEATLSATSNGSQFIHFITSIVIGLTMGTTITMGHLLGAKKLSQTGHTMGTTLTLFTLIAIALTAICVPLSPYFTSFLKVPPEAFSQANDYIRICSYGTIFIVLYSAIGCIFRGIGNSKTPLFLVFVSVIINIIGDLILVGYYKLEAAGAAIATVFAQGVSALWALILIKRRGLPFPFTLTMLKPSWKIASPIFKAGIPLAIQDGLTNISFVVVLAIVNRMGLTQSSAVGAAERGIIFTMLVQFAISAAIATISAQNIGARNIKRAKESLVKGISLSLAFGVPLAFLIFFKGDILTSLFTKDKQTIAQGALYYKAYAIDSILVSILFCFTGFFNGCGKTHIVMLCGITSSFLFRIPLSYIFSKMENATLFHIGLAIPLSTIYGIISYLLYFISNRWAKDFHIDNENSVAYTLAQTSGEPELQPPVQNRK